MEKDFIFGRLDNELYEIERNKLRIAATEERRRDIEKYHRKWFWQGFVVGLVIDVILILIIALCQNQTN